MTKPGNVTGPAFHTLVRRMARSKVVKIRAEDDLAIELDHQAGT